MQLHVIKSLVKKELASYFTNPTGYVFITLFVFLSGLAAFWTPQFFDRNLANLDQLNEWFGILLMLLVPAITMGSWAQERQQGTDELLLTMPATELELVLGKFLGCVSIYFICLVFTCCHVLVLTFLGRPDMGVMFSTYLGYFLAGSALIGVGLAASALSASATISYIAGAVSCGTLVLIGLVERLLPRSELGTWCSAVSIHQHLDSLTKGIIDPADVLYFVGVATLGLLLCVVVVAGRRRAGVSLGSSEWFHAPVRGVALVVIVASAVLLVDRIAVRVDASAERLWSVSPATRKLLASLPQNHPIAITAYVSPRVPLSYVQQRETIIGLLREIQTISRGKVETRVVNTEPNSPEAREAEKSFGIKPRSIPSEVGGVGAIEPVFLGVAISGAGGTAGTEASVIEFFFRGLNAEYELARAIRAAGIPQRKRIGILDTPAGLFGQFDFQTMQQGRDGPIVSELKKQYEVVRIPPGSEYAANLDVLFVAQPSAMKGDEIKRLAEYVKSGKPTLIFDDPFPTEKGDLAIAEPNRPANPMQRGQPPEPKGSMVPLNEVLGARVPGDSVLWDPSSPHPMLEGTPPEVVFITRSGAQPAILSGQPSFNDADPVVSGLQECVILFGGRIERYESKESKATPSTPPNPPEFVPLIRSGPRSGQVPYAGLIQRSMFGTQLNPDRIPTRTNTQYTVAARLTGGENKVNVILVADLDMISSTFFQIRDNGNLDLDFDNVTFVLNAVDSLAGDDTLVELRKRRREFRTLERVEARRKEQAEATQTNIALARDQAKLQLAEAQKRFDAKLEEINKKEDIDESTKQIQINSVRTAEQRKLDAQSALIEDQRRQAIEDARLKTRAEIERIQMSIRLAAVTFPPIPALAIGAIVFLRRRARETAVYAIQEPAPR